MNGAGTSPVRAAIQERTWGRQAPPWQVPRHAWLERLSSSSSVNPLSQAASRSATVVPMHGQTTPSVGGGGSGASSAAAPTTLSGTSPAIRARRSRGARPSPRITVSAGDVVSSPVASSTVTTARTRPSSPSKRTGRPETGVAATPSGGVPTATASPSDTPAACSRSAARAVSRPRKPLPGTTGWISAAPVATTISWAWTWSIPARVRTTSIGPA